MPCGHGTPFGEPCAACDQLGVELEAEFEVGVRDGRWDGDGYTAKDRRVLQRKQQERNKETPTVPDTIDLKIVNAHALEPGKVYVLEGDKTKVSSTQLQAVLHWLTDRAGIQCVAIATHGGDGLRIVEPVAAPSSYTEDDRQRALRQPEDLDE